MVSGALGGAGCGGPWCYQDRLLRAGKGADGKELENADPLPRENKNGGTLMF